MPLRTIPHHTAQLRRGEEPKLPRALKGCVFRRGRFSSHSEDTARVNGNLAGPHGCTKGHKATPPTRHDREGGAGLSWRQSRCSGHPLRELGYPGYPGPCLEMLRLWVGGGRSSTGTWVVAGAAGLLGWPGSPASGFGQRPQPP